MEPPPATISIPLNQTFMNIHVRGGDPEQRLRILHDTPLAKRINVIPSLKLLCMDAIVSLHLKRYSLRSLQEGKFPAAAKRKIRQVAPELIDDLEDLKVCRGYDAGYRQGHC